MTAEVKGKGKGKIKGKIRTKFKVKSNGQECPFHTSKIESSVYCRVWLDDSEPGVPLML